MHDVAIPDHRLGLYLLACLGVIVLGVVILIERHLAEKERRTLADFDASPAGRALQVEKDRFWQIVFDADAATQQHLDESEAAAIAEQHQQRATSA